ncbi:MAG: UpxY family transcription antiterminator [Chlorobi bacterium]|nr:UpxY family transcription antiterminator [Chlorobiota bacterium]
MKSWYAIYTRSRAEKKVIKELTYKDIEAYLPIQKTIRQWSQRKKMVEVPLIPGYCFVNIHPREHFYVQQTDHVVAFVRFNGKPAEIPDYQIGLMKRMLKQSDYAVEAYHGNLSVGEKVSVVAGPLIGMSGELASIRGKKKLIVKIEQINYSFMVEILRTDLMPFHENLHYAMSQ